MILQKIIWLIQKDWINLLIENEKLLSFAVNDEREKLILFMVRSITIMSQFKIIKYISRSC